MKDLTVVRHAKSSWQDPGLDDFERPLNGRGRKAAPLIGAWLSDQKIVPDLVLLSPSVRTVETWGLFKNVGVQFGDERLVDEMYLAGLGVLTGQLTSLSSSLNRVMMIGHNPGLEFLIDSLVGSVEEGEARAFHKLSQKFPTCGVVHLRLAIDQWSDLAPSMGRVYGATSPKLLLAEG